MPAKQKRNLAARENGEEVEGPSPLKRLRIEEPQTVSVGEQNPGVQESPTEIEPEQPEEEEDAIQIDEVPVLDDLYLETVSPVDKM
jgi:hypothetical protein